MYENISMEALEGRMLETIGHNREIDTREGSIVQTATAPCAVEMARMYEALDLVLRETNPASASLEYLIHKCAEKGISPKEATCAEVIAVFVPEDVDVTDRRFTCGDIMFKSIAKISQGEYRLQALEPGTEGNISSGMLIPVDYIDGLENAEITELLIYGSEAEDVESLRKRYFEILDAQAFGGNVLDYKIKTNSINGVGGCKVFPVWNGGGTVKIVFMDEGYNKPADTLVTAVKEELDPSDNEGEGLGLAPIGHVVTVEPVSEVAVNVSSNITFEEGYTFESAIGSIREAIEEYLSEMRSEWDDMALVVRISQIETRLLGLPEVIDVSGTTIGGLAENLILNDTEIPVLGEVTSGQ